MQKIYTVIAAGGLGKRLKNFRDSNTTKMLLKINNESMISKQLNQLISWNLKDFIIVTNPSYDNLIREDIEKNFPNINIEYVIQNKQLGVAHALLQAENLVPKNAKILYILGDNFFQFNPLLNSDNLSSNALIFLKNVDNPKEFGVVELVDDKVKSIEEKPSNPKSNFIAVGLYMFDSKCFEYIKSIKKSDRGEYEITSLIEKYLINENLDYAFTNGWWVDAGTPDAIETIENLL